MRKTVTAYRAPRHVMEPGKLRPADPTRLKTIRVILSLYKGI